MMMAEPNVKLLNKNKRIEMALAVLIRAVQEQNYKSLSRNCREAKVATDKMPIQIRQQIYQFFRKKKMIEYK